MNKENTSGLRLREAYVESGTIKLQTDRVEPITVGSLETLKSLPQYTDGKYETENGFEIDLEEFINSLGFPPLPAREVRNATPCTHDETEISNRMQTFNKYLHTRLEAGVRWVDIETPDLP